MTTNLTYSSDYYNIPGTPLPIGTYNITVTPSGDGSVFGDTTQVNLAFGGPTVVDQINLDGTANASANLALYPSVLTTFVINEHNGQLIVESNSPGVSVWSDNGTVRLDNSSLFDNAVITGGNAMIFLNDSDFQSHGLVGGGQNFEMGQNSILAAEVQDQFHGHIDAESNTFEAVFSGPYGSVTPDDFIYAGNSQLILMNKGKVADVFSFANHGNGFEVFVNPVDDPGVTAVLGSGKDTSDWIASGWIQLQGHSV